MWLFVLKISSELAEKKQIWNLEGCRLTSFLVYLIRPKTPLKMHVLAGLRRQQQNMQGVPCYTWIPTQNGCQFNVHCLSIPGRQITFVIVIVSSVILVYILNFCSNSYILDCTLLTLNPNKQFEIIPYLVLRFKRGLDKFWIFFIFLDILKY